MPAFRNDQAGKETFSEINKLRFRKTEHLIILTIRWHWSSDRHENCVGYGIAWVKKKKLKKLREKKRRRKPKEKDTQWSRGNGENHPSFYRKWKANWWLLKNKQGQRKKEWRPNPPTPPSNQGPTHPIHLEGMEMAKKEKGWTSESHIELMWLGCSAYRPDWLRFNL